MFYLDTCVILAYCIDGDPQHRKAVNLVEKLRQKADKFYASTLTLVELYSVLSRNIQKYRLPPGIEESVNHKNKLQATITYFIQLLSLHILSDEAKLVDLGNLKLFYEFFDAIDLATKLKLKTLDLLHLAYARQFAAKKLVRSFVTFDSQILENKDAILKDIGIEVTDG
jgi:predicted nucleic acid-binding protein